MRTGYANLPLHGGHAPPWLFKRMVPLAKAVTEIVVNEYSQDEFLRRLSDPYWFQAFSCVLGYDWHSSGTTTVTCGALKEALNNENIGIVVAGGKGKTSRKTPVEIEKFGEGFSLQTKKIESLVYSSRMAAKVDSAAVQDGYQLYHHVFVFTENGNWAVIQQGMNPENKYARRYHWLSENVRSFVEEPESAICCDRTEKEVLNMVAWESRDTQNISLDVLTGSNLQKRLDEFVNLVREPTHPTLLHHHENKGKATDGGNVPSYFSLPKSHTFRLSKVTKNALMRASDTNPSDYEELLSLRGIGPASVRALALISEIVYGKPPSWKDPVKYSFAHGGKDGIPYPVDRPTYDKSIEILRSAIDNAKIGDKDKLHALRRLSEFIV